MLNKFFDWIRPAVPRPLRRPLRDLSRPVEAALQYARGKWLLFRYSAHYRSARRVFLSTRHQQAPRVETPSAVGVQIVSPGNSDNIIDLPDTYRALLHRVATCVNERFRHTENCNFVPRLRPGAVRPLIDELGPVRDGEVLSIRLADPYDVDGLAELCEPIVEQVERRLYASHVLVDKVYVYRSPVCRMPARASWIWHYDNHPREVLKVIIYLTDVTAGSAPFEYLRSSSRSPVRGKPLAPLYGNARVPASAVEHHLRRGAESHIVTGPAGTMIVFDNNVVHRANLARDHHRDVIVLQLRPATLRTAPRIDRRWTGSFRDVDFNANPEDLAPQNRE